MHNPIKDSTKEEGMTLKKIFLVALAALALIFAPISPASAAGSDDPTPYTVTVEGLYLPSGDVFTKNSHVNVKNDKGQSYSIHFEEKYADPNHPEWRNLPFNPIDPRNQYYGQSFIPWAAVGIDQKKPYCITWVQVNTDNGYNQHFGEGGKDDPVGTACSTPPDKEEYGPWIGMDFDCTTKVGDIVERSREVTITKFKWDGSVKSVTTVTQTEDYTVIESDLWNIECRTVVTPLVPTIQLAQSTCVSEKSEYIPAVVTLPAVDGGKWTPNESQVTLTRGETTEVVFEVSDDSQYILGDAPQPEEQTFWEAVKTDDKIVFYLVPNKVQELPCDLALSGMEIPYLAIGAAGVLFLGGGILVILHRRTREKA